MGKNNELRPRILSYCVKLRDLQDADNKEVRVRVASNIEDMITGRIMHLIKAHILSPSIATGLGGLSNVMLNKLSNASKVAKEGVRQEMSKHYNRVAITADNESFGNGHYKLPLGEGDAGNGGDKPKVAKPKDAATKPSVFVPRPSDSMYLEPLSDQLARPVFVYKNGKLDRVVGARHKGAAELSVDYVMGKGWTTNGDRSFALTGSGKEEGVAQTSILFKKPEDPRVRLHSPYSNYLANGKMVEPKEAKPTAIKPSAGKPVPPTGNAPSPTATDYTLALMGNAKQKAAELAQGTKEYLFGAGKSQAVTKQISNTAENQQDIKLKGIIQQFAQDNPKYAKEIEKIGYSELKRQLVEVVERNKQSQGKSTTTPNTIGNVVNELFGIPEAEANPLLKEAVKLTPVAKELWLRHGPFIMGALGITTVVNNSDLDKESGGSHVDSISEKRKQEPNTKTPVSKPTASAISGMPDPDDFEPNNHNKNEDGSKRYKDLDPNNPTERKVLENLDTSAEKFIVKHRQAKVLREFPGEYLERTVKEILDEASRGTKAAQTARKLLIDKRFSK